MLVSVLLLVAGFALLIIGAGMLVDGASSLASRFGISELVIGLTVVAFGTSLPELTVNSFNSVNGLNDAVVGNVIGSNIFNTMFILGFVGLIYPIIVNKRSVAFEIPLSIAITILLLILANDRIWGASDAMLRRPDAFILICIFGSFVFYIFKYANFPSEKEEVKRKSVSKTVLLIISGTILLVAGGYQVTNSAVEIAEIFGMSQKLIALTVLSIGTSLPELATSAIAAFRKNTDIAVGNVIGSNIFNIAFILGISTFIHPIQYNIILNTDIYILLFGSLVLFIGMFTGGKLKLDRWEAAILFGSYIIYTIYIINRN